MGKNCPSCGGENSVLDGSKQYERGRRTSIRMGRFCLLCSYEFWEYISEQFLWDCISKLILSKYKETERSGVILMKKIEKKIRDKNCHIKRFIPGSSIQFL